VLAVAHLTFVAVLPALLQMESGGFQHSGGVLGWSAVSPFTALVIHQDKKLQMRYTALFVFVVAFSFFWEAYWRGQGIPHRGLFSGDHEVQVWSWQVYLYAIATSLGVTANAIILMQLLREKSENAIRAHKMLACSIMPPPVAKEVFEIQWQRIREGKLAQRQMARDSRRRTGVGAYFAATGRAGSAFGAGSTYSGASTIRGAGSAFDGDNRKLTIAQRLLGPVLTVLFGDQHSVGADGDRASQSSRTNSVYSWCSGGGLGPHADDDRRSDAGETALSHSMTHSEDSASERSFGFRWDDGFRLDGADPSDVADMDDLASLEAPTSPGRESEQRRSFEGGKRIREEASRAAAADRARAVIPAGGSASATLSGRRRGGGVRARNHADVTVIFIDIVGFSDMCKQIKPIGVLRFLEHYFEMVDKVAEEHGVTKIRTVGDGYLAVCGLMADMGVEADAHQHILRALTFGLGVLMEIRDNGVRLPDGKDLKVRVGMAHGPVFSGVVGRTCMQYDIFGDVANLAARMEQTCPHSAVHMPRESHDKMMAELTEDQTAMFGGLRFEPRADVAIKNMGNVDTMSLSWEGNEDGIERVLAGAIGDDVNRTVTTHIGVMAEAFRQASWSGVNRLEETDDDDEDGEEEGEEGDGETKGVGDGSDVDAAERGDANGRV
jgi:class 3 adenylate cyclase